MEQLGSARCGTSQLSASLSRISCVHCVSVFRYFAISLPWCLHLYSKGLSVMNLVPGNQGLKSRAAGWENRTRSRGLDVTTPRLAFKLHTAHHGSKNIIVDRTAPQLRKQLSPPQASEAITSENFLTRELLPKPYIRISCSGRQDKTTSLEGSSVLAAILISPEDRRVTRL